MQIIVSMSCWYEWGLNVKMAKISSVFYQFDMMIFFLILFLKSVFRVTVAYHNYLSQVVSYIKYVGMTALQ